MPWTQSSLRDEWHPRSVPGLPSFDLCRCRTAAPMCLCWTNIRLHAATMCTIDRCHQSGSALRVPSRSPPSLHAPPPVSRISSSSSYPLLPPYSHIAAHYKPATHIPMARLLSLSPTPAKPSPTLHVHTANRTLRRCHTHSPLTPPHMHRNHHSRPIFSHTHTHHTHTFNAHYHTPTPHPPRTNRTSANSASPSV